MNMFNFMHLMTFLTVVSLKMRCKDTTFCRIMQQFGFDFCNFAPKFKYLR